MSQSRLFCRVGFVVASGLIALIGFVPSGVISTSADSIGGQHTTTQSKVDGPWCC